MRTFKVLLLVSLMVVGFTNRVNAQAANHTVTVEIQAINELAIAGNVSLTISSATAGQDPDDATGSTSYSITTNESSKKITAQTDQALGSGITLAVEATAPSTGTSANSVSLGTTASDVVTGISPVSESAIALAYTLSATAEAGTLASTALTVTYTITN